MCTQRRCGASHIYPGSVSNPDRYPEPCVYFVCIYMNDIYKYIYMWLQVFVERARFICGSPPLGVWAKLSAGFVDLIFCGV